MSYVTNINTIDAQLKKVFSEVDIDKSDYRSLSITLKSPISEEANSKLELKIFVNQTNLNQVGSPILEWGYYPNTEDLTHNIRFQSPIDHIGKSIEAIVDKNMMNKEYLESLKEIEMINESDEEVLPFEEIDNINQTYELSEQHLKIDESKLKIYFENKLGIILDDLEMKYYDPNSGQPRGKFIDDYPKRGDEAVLENITVSSQGGEVSPKMWLTLETEIYKIPFISDVNTNTFKYQLNINFDTRVFVELV